MTALSMPASPFPSLPVVVDPTPPYVNSQISIGRHLALSFGLSIILVIGLGGWASVTEISGAVIAPGQLVVESDVKKVQHPTGGVISELRVREGQRVEAGEVLIRLDETQIRAKRDGVLSALDELSVRRARDEAERDGAKSFVLPEDLLTRSKSEAGVSDLIDEETRLFASRLSRQEGQKAQLRERIAQLHQEIAGLSVQALAKRREIGLIGAELDGVRDLYAKNLVPISRVTALERDSARLEGERGQLIASTAAARGKIAETELQILQVDGDVRTEASKDLAEIRGKWSELVETRIVAEDQLKRVDMRAPQDGTVHQLMVHTIGGLVTSSEPAMLIVPDGDQLVAEVHIQPQDIDSVRTGQEAMLRLSAFNTRTTPEVTGVVSRVSADVTQDPKIGVNYYTARIRIAPDQHEHLAGLRLVSGMPVDAYLQIGARSVMSYLTKPLTDQLAKAWRER